MPSVLRRLFLAALLCFALSPAFAQSYTSVLVFGDSLSDTGNVAHLTQSQYLARIPGPLFGYTDGSFTDGTDTLPQATLYTGVWIRQLAATFPARPPVVDSLDGGTNYAYGYAFTGTGTSALDLATGISVNVDNLNQQVTDYLTTHTTIPANTLVVVWAGANDILNATAQADVSTAASNELTAIQRLITAGATDLMIANLPPLGAIPRLNTNSTLSMEATAGAQGFNALLAVGLSSLPSANPSVTLHVFPLDIFTLFKTVIASPSTYNLGNVTMMSQSQSVNPDTFLFWDDLHPTTAGHHLIALAAAAALTAGPTPVVTTTTVTSSALTANLGDSVTFSATVAALSGTAAPSGTVTFYDGTTALGTATLTASGPLTSVATLPAITSFTAGTHSITAAFAAGSGFGASTSAAITQTVVAPSITVTASPTTITVNAGSSGASTLTVTPAGGFNGSVSIACGSLPVNATCVADDTPPQTFSTPKTFTVTLGTNGKQVPVPASMLPLTLTGPAGLLGLLSLPGFAALVFARRRFRRLPPVLLGLVFAFALTPLLGLAGCGGSSHNTARGTYTIPVVVTPSTGAATTLNLMLIVQ